jgi:hypothetical protein
MKKPLQTPKIKRFEAAGEAENMLRNMFTSRLSIAK